jgi:hypothetical protein
VQNSSIIKEEFDIVKSHVISIQIETETRAKEE